MTVDITRPRLKPGLRRIWRDRQTLQIGVEPARAVVITGLDRPAARFLDAIDGTIELTALLELADAQGLGRPAATGLLELLEAAGLLDDAGAERAVLRDLTRPERERLRPDLAASALVHADRSGGSAVLRRRRAATVRVVGIGRIGASLASVLAAAGLGCLQLVDETPVGPGDLAPAGHSPAALGRSRASAAADRVAAIAASTAVTCARDAGPADLVVLCSEVETGPQAFELMRTGTAHLYVGARETSGVVGPMVLPGRSACARCLDLHRSDRDPGWPAVAAQLSVPQHGCEVLLATVLAGLAGAQVLARIDAVDGLDPSTVDGTLEVSLPELRTRRRSWRLHPCCGCAWPADESPPDGPDAAGRLASAQSAAGARDG